MGTFLCICKKYDDWSDDSDNFEEDWNDERTMIEHMFPDAKFAISIRLSDLNDIVSPLDKIIVKQTFDCYCYRGIGNAELQEPCQVPKWFPIHCRETGMMTVRHVVNELIRQGMSLDCNHCFLEGITQSSKGGDCQFELIIGS